MRQSSFLFATLPLSAALTLLASCDAGRSPAPPQEQNRSQSSAPMQSSDLRQRQLAFLNRIREADPQGHTIDRALLNEQNELGLILDRSVEMQNIPPLLKTMLTKMASEFPGEDLTVVAYAPSNPPRKIGTAHLNAATRDMTYTPEK
ncbi:MAG: hypothetical protein M3Y80_11190 [Verrucomicrobiota bacterium]|nr:hypothetical protein [Verrucomicrobiota bacterium]